MQDSSTTPDTPTFDVAKISEAVQSLIPYMIKSLSDFVAIASLPGNETPAAEYMEQLLADLGLQSERIHLNTETLKGLPLFSPPCCPDGGRYNILATHKPKSASGRSVLFNGHLDVVPTGPHDFWTNGPFSGEVRDGWLYGRGAGDMKAGIVCTLAAFKALRSLGVQPAANVGFNGVLEEENTGNGTLAVVSALRNAISTAKLTAFDAVLIPEPTQETLQKVQLGVFWLYVDIIGKPAHAGYMTTGLNPVEIGLQIVDTLKELEHEWNLPENRHPDYLELEHPINFNLGQIHAGDWNSSVPSVCTLGLRLSCYPDISIEEAKAIVTKRIRDVEARSNDPDVKVNIRHEGFNAPGCEFDLTTPPMLLLADAHLRVFGQEPAARSMTATTDARHFKIMLDVPVTCYGPEASNIHGFDECVSIASMVRVTTVLALFMQDWCGIEPLPA
ncbi:ArgE/DapE family deacylase [Alcaligenaceae bacterium]|nr:ArgE/DapE family deacylase [Alcaligenaceae bacterium]